MSAPTITKPLFRHEEFGLTDVTAKMTDGTVQHLFHYYRDELAFNETELLGLTESQARALRHARDVEYLQS